MPLFGRKTGFNALVTSLGPGDCVERATSFVELGGQLSGDQVAELREDLSRRESVARELGATADPRAVEPLLELAATPAMNVRAGPVVTLSDVERLQASAVDALGALGVEAVPSLVTTLSDTDGRRRAVAASVLGLIGDSRAIEPLIEALRDGEYKVRESAAEALGLCRDSRATHPLLTALDDNAPSVRDRSRQGLVSLGEHANGAPDGRPRR